MEEFAPKTTQSALIFPTS